MELPVYNDCKNSQSDLSKISQISLLLNFTSYQGLHRVNPFTLLPEKTMYSHIEIWLKNGFIHWSVLFESQEYNFFGVFQYFSIVLMIWMAYALYT